MNQQIHNQFAKEYLEELLSPLGSVKKSQKLQSKVLEVDTWFEPSPLSPDIPLGTLEKMVSGTSPFEPDRNPKEYLEELLSPLGSVRKSQKIQSEVLEVDIWFEPSLSSLSPDISLGILGKMVSGISLFDAYQNPIDEDDIGSYILKSLIAYSDFVEETDQKEDNSPLLEPPSLWILAPTCSSRIIEAAGAEESESENWTRGIYFLPPIFRTALVVIHQLPIVEETLWLRVLGRGNVQRQAVEELVDLPDNNPYKENLLEILSNWHKNLEMIDNKTIDEQEIFMNLSPAYFKQREE